MTIRHLTIKARDLRAGDLMRLASGTNYVLISSATVIGEQTRLTTYNGEDPDLDGASFSYEADKNVDLSGRGLGPNDRIAA